jgi:hypothetical protein
MGGIVKFCLCGGSLPIAWKPGPPCHPVTLAPPRVSHQAKDPWASWKDDYRLLLARESPELTRPASHQRKRGASALLPRTSKGLTPPRSPIAISFTRDIIVNRLVRV